MQSHNTYNKREEEEGKEKYYCNEVGSWPFIVCSFFTAQLKTKKAKWTVLKSLRCDKSIVITRAVKGMGILDYSVYVKKMTILWDNEVYTIGTGCDKTKAIELKLVKDNILWLLTFMKASYP